MCDSELPHRLPAWPEHTDVLKKMREGGYDSPRGFCEALVLLGAVRAVDETEGLCSYLEERGELLRFGADGVVRRLADLALAMPKLFPPEAAVPRLAQGSETRVQLSPCQCAALLACGFLGLVPAQPDNDLLRDRGRLSFEMWWLDRSEWEKLSCFHQYVASVALDEPPGRSVVFVRKRRSHTLSWWCGCEAPLCGVDVDAAPDARIEDCEGEPLLVDFANKRVGGGVLRGGAAQEELLFLAHPELMTALLFTEELANDETLEVCGVRRACNYRGYGRTFEFAGEGDARVVRMVAMDAAAWPMDHQFSEELLLRELNKAVCGLDPAPVGAYPYAATGNWGCGCFGGDAQLKALLQWAAASALGVRLRYLSTGNPALEQLPQVLRAVIGESANAERATVGWLCRTLVQHGQAHLADVRRLDGDDEGTGAFDAVLAAATRDGTEGPRCALV